MSLAPDLAGGALAHRRAGAAGARRSSSSSRRPARSARRCCRRCCASPRTETPRVRLRPRERRRRARSTRRSCASTGSTRRPTCSRASSACAYQVGKLPYAVLIDARGRRARQGPRQHARAPREPVRGDGARAWPRSRSSWSASTLRAALERRRSRRESSRDRLVERAARGLARRAGRRSFLARLGGAARRRRGAAAAAGRARGRGDAAGAGGAGGRPRAGGRPDELRVLAPLRDRRLPLRLLRRQRRPRCPPGTEMSPVTWIGTCRNPADGKDYIISYNDCCGKSFCGRCSCNRNEGDRPDYHSSATTTSTGAWAPSSRSTTARSRSWSGRATEPQPER